MSGIRMPECISCRTDHPISYMHTTVDGWTICFNCKPPKEEAHTRPAGDTTEQNTLEDFFGE